MYLNSILFFLIDFFFLFSRQNPISFGDMQKQSWSLTGEADTLAEEGDDDDDVQLGNNTFYKRNTRIQNEDEEEEEQQQQTLTAEHPQKTARQTMIERKMHESDVRAQTFAYKNNEKVAIMPIFINNIFFRDAARSNVIENAQNRYLMRESTMVGTVS